MRKLIFISFSFVVAMFTFGMMTTGVSAEEHDVEKGDTLWDIANTYRTTVEKLKDINHLDDTVIYPDQILSTAQDNEKHYTVEKGDTLSEIAEEFDVSVENIKEQNGLSSDLIVVGKELTIDVSNHVQKVSNDEPKQTENVSAAEDNEEKATEQASDNESTEASTEEQPASPKGETFSVSATAYTAYCDGCSGITATGVNLMENPDKKVIAVDPNVIPLGTKVYVEGYGYATAEDTGGDIKGNRIDVHIPSKDEALDWGIQSVDITIIDE
ncbi:MAG TPA: LysM peptidoglycan-binding domain-containing protein [Virgibacillus sp.]|nr:LysM peptidoglycan-binding domain-containing protein [Virgibacillus sp.]